MAALLECFDDQSPEDPVIVEDEDGAHDLFCPSITTDASRGKPWCAANRLAAGMLALAQRSWNLPRGL
jgi:hypothetical protein